MQVLTEDDPVFSRLEHQKVHEYARGVVSRKIFPSTPRVPVDGTSMPRRRGRPLKNPNRVIPVIPKTEMSEEEIQRLVMSLWSDTEARLVVSCGFKQYDPSNPCPDSKCMFVTEKLHYHCVRPRCYYATNRRDMLNLHARDFHSFINILDGFEFFDRSVDCRRDQCTHNHERRHFHCVRPRCDYSFVRFSTMAQHDKKHNMAKEPSVSLQSQSVVGVNGSLSTAVPGMSAVYGVPGIVKPLTNHPLIPLILPPGAVQQHALSHRLGGTTGVAVTTVTPVVIQSVSSSPIALTSSVVNMSSNVARGVAPVTSLSTVTDVAKNLPQSTVSSTLHMTNNPLLSSLSSSNLVTIAPKPSTSSTLPLSGLLQQQQLQQQQQQQGEKLSWLTLKMNMHYGMHQNCGRPFCKLKKKDHYHCCECNQAFSNPIRLKMHIAKHRTKNDYSTNQCDAAPIDGAADAGSSSDTNGDLSSSLNLSMTTFANMLSKEQPNSLDDDDDDNGDSDGLVIDLSLPPSECGDSCTTPANVDDNNKEDDMLDNSEVERQREMTKQLNVAMPTETQPILIGRRQDGVPEGYVRFRHVEDCGFIHCTYRHTVTHYHCARPNCGHAFSDRTRTQHHAKRHRRTDAIMADDFEHFRIHIDCQHADCEYARTMSHYHCRRCEFVCTDTAKVIAHRKHHVRLTEVEVQGYRKFTKREACNFETCRYSGKLCHYHCLQQGCSQVMLGSAQVTAHKNRHRDASLGKANDMSVTKT